MGAIQYNYYELLSRNAGNVWALLEKYNVKNKDGLQNNVIEAYRQYGDKFALDLIDVFAKNEIDQWSNYKTDDKPVINFTPQTVAEYNKTKTQNALNGATSGATSGSFWNQLSGISDTVFNVLGGAVGVFGAFNKAKSTVDLEKYAIDAEARLREEERRKKQNTTTIIIVVAVLLILTIGIIFLTRKKK